MLRTSRVVLAGVLALTTVLPGFAAPVPQSGPAQDRSGAAGNEDLGYVLGPDDQLKVWALGLDEIPDRPFRVDARGTVDIPFIGRVQAGGQTLGAFRQELLKRLESQIWSPQVSVEIVEFGGQPVTVLGAVMQPGQLQLHGRKTLAEVLSMAGGLRPDSGHGVKITRPKQYGAIPLGSAKWDASGNFSVAEVEIKGMMDAQNPADNILVQPHDVITVPIAETVYVIGDVGKPGAIVLKERGSISVLQALATAEGLAPNAKPADAKILRTPPGGSQRVELPVNLKDVLTGRAEDLSLRANDILFVPDNASKRAGVRAIEAAIQTVTGVVIWHR
jgi:polysaccharide export outer membrane protein